jgi:hypothetical protein
MEIITQLNDLIKNDGSQTVDTEKIMKSVTQLAEQREILKQMVRNTPNDMDLGKTVRSYYSALNNDKEI